MYKNFIQDRINIIPCFNEKKSWKTPKWLPIPRYISSSKVTPENYSARPGIVEGEFSKEVPWKLAACSDKKFYEINEIMKAKRKVEKKYGVPVPSAEEGGLFGGDEEKELNRCNFDNRLGYLSTTTWDAQKKCDDVKLEPFWNNLANHIRLAIQQQQEQRFEGIYNFIIVGHHNRMRKQFLPLQNEKDGYANCFCVKLVCGQGRPITPEVVFHGFPDKSDYNYVMNTDDLNNGIDSTAWRKIEGILQRYIVQSGIIANLYFIRHGNALHNKPLGVKKPDSPLTPVGLYQASYLGTRLRYDGYLTNGYTALYASYLIRSQQTALQTTFSLFSTSGKDTTDNILPSHLAYMQKLYSYYIFKVGENILSKKGATVKGPEAVIERFSKIFVENLWDRLQKMTVGKRRNFLENSRRAGGAFIEMLQFKPKPRRAAAATAAAAEAAAAASAAALHEDQVITLPLLEKCQGVGDDGGLVEKILLATVGGNKTQMCVTEELQTAFADGMKTILASNIADYQTLAEPTCKQFCLSCDQPCENNVADGGGRRRRSSKRKRRRRKKKKKSKKYKVKHKYFGIKKGKIVKIYAHKVFKKIGRHSSSTLWKTTKKNLPGKTYHGKFYKTRKLAKNRN